MMIAELSEVISQHSLNIPLKKKAAFAAFCAQDKTRTCTLLTAPAPQAGVSTNSTTWAFSVCFSYTVVPVHRNEGVPGTGLEPAHPCEY
jgi:hypothetical protein